MNYQVRCTVCPFDDTVEGVDAAHALERAHADELGDDHVFDIVLVQ